MLSTGRFSFLCNLIIPLTVQNKLLTTPFEFRRWFLLPIFKLKILTKLYGQFGPDQTNAANLLGCWMVNPPRFRQHKNLLRFKRQRQKIAGVVVPQMIFSPFLHHMRVNERTVVATHKIPFFSTQRDVGKVWVSASVVFSHLIEEKAQEFLFFETRGEVFHLAVV